MSRLNLIRATGIKIGAFFITGFPRESEADLIHTVDFAQEVPISSYYFGVARLLPGSQMLDENPVPEDAWFEGYSKKKGDVHSPCPEYRSHYTLSHDLDLEQVIHYANARTGFTHFWRCIALYRMTRPFFRAFWSFSRVLGAQTVLYGGKYPFHMDRPVRGRLVDVLAGLLGEDPWTRKW